MRKLVIILAMVFLLIAPACASFWHGGDTAIATLKEFLGIINTKVSHYCDVGYMPPAACSEWAELYAEAGEKLQDAEDLWNDLKNGWKVKILEFVLKFLDWKFTATKLAYYQKLPTSEEIREVIEAANAAHLSGWLTAAEVEAVREAGAKK